MRFWVSFGRRPVWAMSLLVLCICLSAFGFPVSGASGVSTGDSSGPDGGNSPAESPSMDLYHYGDSVWVRVDRISIAGPTALLIHGLMGSHFDMTALARRLSDPRYGTAYDVYAVQYSLGNDLNSLAGRLQSIVAGATFAPSLETNPDFLVVAHSMGGLLARYVIESGRPTPIDRFVTLSSPLNGNQGSLIIADTADSLDLPYARVMPELDDMKTGSGFLAYLNSPMRRSLDCKALFVAGTLPEDSVASGMLKNVLLTPNDGVVEQWSAWGLPAPQSGAVTPEEARAKSILVRRYASCDFESVSLHHWAMCGHPEVLALIDGWLGRGW